MTSYSSPSPSSDFYLDPSEVEAGANHLVELSEELTDNFSPVFQSSMDVSSAFDSDVFQGPSSIISMTDEWKHFRYRRLERDVEQLGNSVRVFVEEFRTADDVSATELTTLEEIPPAPVPSSSPSGDTPAPAAI